MKLVQTDAGTRKHIVDISPGDDWGSLREYAKALCGKIPFPERWQGMSGVRGLGKEVCPTCRAAFARIANS